MNSAIQVGPNTDVVITVSWTCAGATDDDPPVQSFHQDNTSIPFTDEGPFTPYADLTQEQVLGWVWANGVDKDAIEAEIAANIGSMITPSVVTLPLPWAPPAA